MAADAGVLRPRSCFIGLLALLAGTRLASAQPTTDERIESLEQRAKGARGAGWSAQAAAVAVAVAVGGRRRNMLRAA